jgi:hypothetical protein
MQGAVFRRKPAIVRFRVRALHPARLFSWQCSAGTGAPCQACAPDQGVHLARASSRSRRACDQAVHGNRPMFRIGPCFGSRRVSDRAVLAALDAPSTAPCAGTARERACLEIGCALGWAMLLSWPCVGSGRALDRGQARKWAMFRSQPCPGPGPCPGAARVRNPPVSTKRGCNWGSGGATLEPARQSTTVARAVHDEEGRIS